MKVKDLITYLQASDPELMVVVDGYEGGVGELHDVGLVRLSLDANNAWYYGKHEITHDSFAPYDCKAVYLSRTE